MIEPTTSSLPGSVELDNPPTTPENIEIAKREATDALIKEIWDDEFHGCTSMPSRNEIPLHLQGRDLQGRVEVEEAGSESGYSSATSPRTVTSSPSLPLLEPVEEEDSVEEEAEVASRKSTPGIVPESIEIDLTDEGLEDLLRELDAFDEDDIARMEQSLHGPLSHENEIETIHLNIGENEPTAEMTDEEYTELKAQFSGRLTRDLSGFELDLLLKLLEGNPDSQQQFGEWLILARQGQGKKARAQIQKFLNKHIKFTDALKISCHQKRKKWKMMSTKQKVKSVAYVGAKAVFLPIYLVGKMANTTRKLSTSKKYRKELKKALKRFLHHDAYSYQTRKKIASLVLKYGMSAVIALAIAGEIGSGGLATPAIVGITALALGGAAKVGNDVAKGKSSGQILGSLIADTARGATEGAFVAGFYAGVSDVLGMIFEEAYQDSDRADDTVDTIEGHIEDTFTAAGSLEVGRECVKHITHPQKEKRYTRDTVVPVNEDLQVPDEDPMGSLIRPVREAWT